MAREVDSGNGLPGQRQFTDLAMRRYLASLSRVFPCSKCRSSLASYLDLYGTRGLVAGNALRWVYDLHSFVNLKLGRTQVQEYLTYERYLARMHAWACLSTWTQVQDWCVLVTMNMARQALKHQEGRLHRENLFYLFVHCSLLLHFAVSKGWVLDDVAERNRIIFAEQLQTLQANSHQPGQQATRNLLLAVARLLDLQEPIAKVVKRLSAAIVP